MTWWADDGQRWPCCLRADPDERTTYADEFDCGQCLVRAHHAALWPENVDAWNLYHQVGRRFFVEFGLVGDRLRVALTGMDDETIAETLDRLALIDGVLRPPKR